MPKVQQITALLKFVQGETKSLASVFQSALTFTLAFKATASLDSSADNIVIMVR